MTDAVLRDIGIRQGVGRSKTSFVTAHQVCTGLAHHRRVTLMCKAEAYMEFGNASSHNIDNKSNLLNGSQRNYCTAE